MTAVPQPEHSSAEEFVNEILGVAVTVHASDIHIEPLTQEFRVRFRIDGVLQERWRRPLHEYEAVLNRVKVLANLDLTAHSITQDGHFEALVAEKIPAEKQDQEETQASIPTQWFDQGSSPPLAKSADARPVNVRVSLFPTITGSTIVLRLLNRADLLRRLEDLEMDVATLGRYKRLIARVYGLVLITGPAGSGKTTTLYATLQELESPEKNIITLEDPIEFHFEQFRQTQISVERGFSFADAMRSVLRQDPDALMIGEIRDPETAEYAVRAALIGRLVISTVHSNTTVGTIARLLDMNIDRSLIAYALNGVMARRLVRRICEYCRTPYKPEEAFLSYLGLKGDTTFMKGAGCGECRGTGHSGRVGLFEVLEMDNNLRTLIIEKAPMDALQQYVEQSRIKMLKDDAREKVLAGLITVEEAMKAV